MKKDKFNATLLIADERKNRKRPKWIFDNVKIFTGKDAPESDNPKTEIKR